MIVAVVGLGTWGTALAQVLGDNGHKVTIYGRDEGMVNEINTNHTNSKYFSNEIKLNPSITASSNLEEAIKDAKVIVLSVPSKSYRSILETLKDIIKNKVIIVSTAKGFDPSTYERLSSLIREMIPFSKREEVVSLIGPSHAEEVIKRLLTLVTATSTDVKVAKVVQELFSNNYFRVYTNTDEIGSEYGAAIKNVIAIASGCLCGLGYGDNTRAALITRGLAEMARFGVIRGGRKETYLGLNGIGDLLVTCASWNSRNFNAGYEIGKCDSAKEFLKNNKKTVEGIKTAEVIYKDSLVMGIEMPIVESVYNVLYLNKNPSEEILKVMNRPLKEE